MKGRKPRQVAIKGVTWRALLPLPWRIGNTRATGLIRRANHLLPASIGLVTVTPASNGVSELDQSSEQEVLARPVVAPVLTRPKVAAIGCGQWGRNIVRNLSQLGALSALSDLC